MILNNYLPDLLNDIIAEYAEFDLEDVVNIDEIPCYAK